jgi:hypothetical protein
MPESNINLERALLLSRFKYINTFIEYDFYTCIAASEVPVYILWDLILFLIEMLTMFTELIPQISWA